MDSLGFSVVAAIVFFASFICYRLAADIISPSSPPRFSSPSSSLPTSIMSSPGPSSGHQMRRWLRSLLLVSLTSGTTVLFLELLVFGFNEPLSRENIPIMLLTTLRFTPLIALAAAQSSLVVYFATLINSITGRPSLLARKHWIMLNAAALLCFLLVTMYTSFLSPSRPSLVYLIIMATHLITFSSLLTFGLSILRTLPSISSTYKRIHWRLESMVVVYTIMCLIMP